MLHDCSNAGDDGHSRAGHNYIYRIEIRLRVWKFLVLLVLPLLLLSPITKAKAIEADWKVADQAAKTPFKAAIGRPHCLTFEML
jgi:hypothetical protein